MTFKYIKLGKDFKPIEVKEIEQASLTSDCWFVQMDGFNHCSDCEQRYKPNCGGGQSLIKIRSKHYGELNDLITNCILPFQEMSFKEARPVFMSVHHVEDAINEYLLNSGFDEDQASEHLNDVIREIEEKTDTTIEYTQYHEYQLTDHSINSKENDN